MGKPVQKAWVIEANLDDMNPQWFGHVMDRLFEAGALDVWLENIQMKKNRPAVLLRVLTGGRTREKAIRIMMEETTTLGVRYYRVNRRVLERKLTTRTTRWGRIPVKIAWDRRLKIQKIIPEYEACRRLARRKKIPLREIYAALLKSGDTILNSKQTQQT